MTLDFVVVCKSKCRNFVTRIPFSFLFHILKYGICSDVWAFSLSEVWKSMGVLSLRFGNPMKDAYLFVELPTVWITMGSSKVLEVSL